METFWVSDKGNFFRKFRNSIIRNKILIMKYRFYLQGF